MVPIIPTVYVLPFLVFGRLPVVLVIVATHDAHTPLKRGTATASPFGHIVAMLADHATPLDFADQGDRTARVAIGAMFVLAHFVAPV
jgi:hypothetical protein